MHFGPHHQPAPVDLGADGVIAERLPETRPASSTLEFRLRRKQLLTARGADEDAGPLLCVERARERALGAVPAENPVAVRRQHGPPFGVGLLYGKGSLEGGRRRIPAREPQR